MSLYEQNLERNLKAVRMEKVDRIPFSWNGPAYLPKRHGLTIADAISDFPSAVSASVEFCKEHPTVDSFHSPCITPYSLPTLWLADVKVPGVELPDDELWQMDERERMTIDDYQAIIDNGYGPWRDAFMKERINNPLGKPDAQAFFAYVGTAFQRMATEAGVPVLNGGFGITPIENFCGARGLENFFMDMYEEPELVKEAMDVAWPTLLGEYLSVLESKPVGAWVGGWRAAPELLSHDTWMEFVWPYLEEMVVKTVEAGVIPVLHFDSNWESELETLKLLPEKSCMLMLDGATDMRKAREVLDDRMCLLGDVPPQMLAFGTPSEVYDYTTKLIDDVGPKTGLIISSGCDCPLNAKDENVDAMIQATADYQV